MTNSSKQCCFAFWVGNICMTTYGNRSSLFKNSISDFALADSAWIDTEGSPALQYFPQNDSYGKDHASNSAPVRSVLLTVKKFIFFHSSAGHTWTCTF